MQERRSWTTAIYLTSLCAALGCALDGAELDAAEQQVVGELDFEIDHDDQVFPTGATTGYLRHLHQLHRIEIVAGQGHRELLDLSIDHLGGVAFGDQGEIWSSVIVDDITGNDRRLVHRAADGSTHDFALPMHEGTARGTIVRPVGQAGSVAWLGLQTGDNDVGWLAYHDAEAPMELLVSEPTPFLLGDVCVTGRGNAFFSASWDGEPIALYARVQDGRITFMGRPLERTSSRGLGGRDIRQIACHPTREEAVLLLGQDFMHIRPVDKRIELVAALSVPSEIIERGNRSCRGESGCLGDVLFARQGGVLLYGDLNGVVAPLYASEWRTNLRHGFSDEQGRDDGSGVTLTEVDFEAGNLVDRKHLLLTGFHQFDPEGVPVVADDYHSIQHISLGHGHLWVALSRDVRGPQHLAVVPLNME